MAKLALKAPRVPTRNKKNRLRQALYSGTSYLSAPLALSLSLLASWHRDLAERRPGKFRMVAVTVDESWDVVREFFGGPMPPAVAVAIDADQATTRAYYCAARGSCPDSFKFPETYVVDRSGRLVAYMVGPRLDRLHQVAASANSC